MDETKTEYSSQNGTAQLTVTGPLYSSAECDAFLSILHERVTVGDIDILINLRGCPAVSSYWIGQVLAVNAQVKAAGGKITVAGVRKEIQAIFSAMALDQALIVES